MFNPLSRFPQGASLGGRVPPISVYLIICRIRARLDSARRLAISFQLAMVFVRPCVGRMAARDAAEEGVKVRRFLFVR